MLRLPLRRAARDIGWRVRRRLLHKEAAATTTSTSTSASSQPRHNDTDYLQKILTARVYDVAHETPLQPARILSQQLRNNVLLKREDTQDVFSFKIRGAYNRMASLSADERQRGVVTCSAGNHAQGVALAAKKLDVDVTIVMPTTTPEIKVDSVRSRGARVLLHGESFQEAAAEAHRIQAREQRVLVHPYDCPLVIAGQGTIGMEIVKQATDLDVIFCPVGGGGLIAGVAAYVKRVRPSVKVIGVEASDSAGMSAALEAGERVTLSHVGTFADGTAVKQVGAETFRLCSQFVDDMIQVDTDQICAALKDFFVETRSILEPSGALAVAGLREYVQRSQVRGSTLVAVASGANMDFSRLRYVAERAEAQEKMLAIRIPETPGSFNCLYDLLSPRDITAFSYRYASTSAAEVYVSFRSAGDNDVGVVIDSLESAGLRTLDLSQNELAKVHGRYLVGGRCPQPVENELLYRFEFPERPGALGKFLRSLNAGWNVSLFHYKQAGGDVGYVLAGLQVPLGEHDAFELFLEGLRYPYTNESTNQLYERFLS